MTFVQNGMCDQKWSYSNTSKFIRFYLYSSSSNNSSHDIETNLRKTLVKSRLAECQEKLPRSDSLDSMLGDSLLDPPQCLQKIPPKRYQSPSRCGSPSLEAPDHLLFGNTSGKY